MMPDVLHRTAWKEMRRRGAKRHGGDGRAEGDESDEAEGREVDVDERVLNDVEENVEKEGRGKAVERGTVERRKAVLSVASRMTTGLFRDSGLLSVASRMTAGLSRRCRLLSVASRLSAGLFRVSGLLSAVN